MVPQSLRDYAKLEKDVVLIGALKRFEVWSKPVWDATEASMTVEDIGEMFEELGL